jgi:hypothetical protein
MTEDVYQFDFSEDQANNRYRNILFVFIPAMIVCVIGFGLFITDFQVKKVLLCTFPALLIMFVIIVIEKPLVYRSLRKIKAFVNNDKIVKQCGKHENSIRWDNITKLKISKNRKGEIVRIQLRKKDKTVLWLGGLNEMERLAGLIRERVPDDILMNTKSSRLDIRIMGIAVIFITFIIVAIIASFGSKAMDIFAIVAAFAVPLYLLLFRPLSKICISSKWFEIIISLLMLMWGIYGLVIFLISGRLP